VGLLLLAEAGKIEGDQASDAAQEGRHRREVVLVRADAVDENERIPRPAVEIGDVEAGDRGRARVEPSEHTLEAERQAGHGPRHGSIEDEDNGDENRQDAEDEWKQRHHDRRASAAIAAAIPSKNCHQSSSERATARRTAAWSSAVTARRTTM